MTEEELIAKVRSGELTERGMINLYNNVRGKSLPGVIAAIERQMRGQFPRAANRLFGRKESVAIQRLQEALALLEGEDLRKNAVKNGVKPGGEKISGRKYLNVYASYRNSAGIGCFLSLEQETIDSELFVSVGKYKIGRDRFRDERRFTMDAFGEAAVEFARLVRELAGVKH